MDFILTILSCVSSAAIKIPFSLELLVSVGFDMHFQWYDRVCAGSDCKYAAVWYIFCESKAFQAKNALLFLINVGLSMKRYKGFRKFRR